MKLKIVIFSLLLQFTIFSQNNCNAYLKAKLSNKSIQGYLDVLVKGNIQLLSENSNTLDFQIKYSAGNIASLRILVSDIPKLLRKNFIDYLEYRPSHLSLLNDTMRVKNRIEAVKQGLAPLAQSYDGTGVIVGVIDSGIDFNHPDFKESNGNTRISFIWDQNQVSGSTIPQPYSYGIEWTAAQINASVCTHNDLANYGHGTHVSGTAAGNGLANGKHEGIASKAELIVVALNFNNTTNTIYADAVQYIFNKATAANKPCVINASVGDYYGSHDGTDLETQLINNMLLAQNKRVLVAAAGNAGNIKYHVKTNVINTDTLYTWFSSGAIDLEYYIYADTNEIKNVKTSIGVNRTNFENIGRVPFKNWNDAISTEIVDTLKNGSDRIGIIKTNASVNSMGVYELYYHIIADSLNYLWRIESKGIGKHHSWNFNLVSSSLPTATIYPNIINYAMPDTISTIVSGFQCSNEVITVGNYINLNTYYDVNNTLQTTTETAGKIKETSSGGPTRTNLIKPDVVATGANVFSAMALGMQANLIANLPSAVAQGSMHVQGGGTSASSPVVAGLAALYLQAYPNANHQQVKQAIVNCTYSDGFTGTLPNNVYGYGKLDGKAAMLCTVFTYLDERVLTEQINAFPNPFSDNVVLKLNTKDEYTLCVYDATGKQLLQQSFISNSVELNTANFNNYKGLLFVRIQSPTKAYSTKLISN